MWDSGSLTVLVTDMLTHTLDGTQCPGCTWKKYHLLNLKCHGRCSDASQQVERNDNF